MQLLTFDLALIVIWSKNKARSHPLHIIHTTTTTALPVDNLQSTYYYRLQSKTKEHPTIYLDDNKWLPLILYNCFAAILVDL